MESEKLNVHKPGSLSPVTGVPETEFASKNRLPNVALDLKHLRAAFGLAVELEHESGVRLSLHIQVKLRRRAFGFFTNGNPTVMENGTGPGLRTRQIQRHGDFSQKPPGADAAGGASSPCVDRDSQA